MVTKVSIKSVFFSIHFFVLIGLVVFSYTPILVAPIHIPIEFWVRQTLFCFYWMMVFYLLMEVLIPRFLFRNKVAQFSLILLGMLFLAGVLNHLFDSIVLHGKDLIPKPPHDEPKNGARLFIIDMFITIVTMLLCGTGIVVAITKKLQQDKLREKTIENEKISNELAFLKTQINPHFFFNVLHTIYGLTDVDIRKAKDSIYTLSHMMRYVLYETHNDQTTLEKELNFVESYNKLMRIRISEDVQVIFDRPPVVENVIIAPMIFLPFIENAFKHGISSIFPSYIYIGVSYKEKRLEIEVRNSNFNASPVDKEESNEIGLANTQRRLNLLYPGKHQLVVVDNKQAKEFLIRLKLDLS